MKKNILIIGAGTGGISVAARLRKILTKQFNISIIDPQEIHFYQPLWSLVGAGVFDHKASEKKQSTLIPKGVVWIKQKVVNINTGVKTLTLDNQQNLNYDYLIVAAGIKYNWEKIKGAKEALNTPEVCSNYLPYGSIKTFKIMREIQSGNAIFTQPPFPIKCPGATQKPMYLADSYFRKHKKRKKIEVIYGNNGPRIFGVEKYKRTLEKVLIRKEIKPFYEHNLIEIKYQDKIAVFIKPDQSLVEIRYEMLHVVPPMSSPDFIRDSTLADKDGWVEVDMFTLQHKRFPEIFSIGDCSSLPTSKTGAAIRKQAPVLVANLISHIKNEPLTKKYSGYTSCPLVTDYGKVIMAEFDYQGIPVESFPIDQSKERYSMWLVKAYLLPKLYWYGMLKGWA